MMRRGHENRFDVIGVFAGKRAVIICKAVMPRSKPVVLLFARMIGNHDAELAASDLLTYILKVV